MDPRQVVILGMHRSGTSALTGVLSRAGLFVGDDDALTGKNWQNPQGFFERRDARAICDALLHGSGADWWKVSSFDPDNADHATVREQRPKITQLVADLDAQGVSWALKEPRLCFLLPIFRSALERPLAIIVHRHPLEVAKSLRRRNGFPIRAGLALWEAYMVAALRHGLELDHVRVGYDDLLGDPEATLKRIGAAIQASGGEAIDVQAGVEGVKPQLRREQAKPEDSAARLSPAQAALWELLSSPDDIERAPELSFEAVKVLREFEADEAERHALRQSIKARDVQLKTATELADQRQQELKAQTEKLNELKRVQNEAAELKGRIDGLEGERGQLMERRDELHGALRSKETELAERGHELDRAKREADSMRQEAETATADRNRLQRTLAQREEALSAAKTEIRQLELKVESLWEALRERTVAETRIREDAEQAAARNEESRRELKRLKEELSAKEGALNNAARRSESRAREQDEAIQSLKVRSGQVERERDEVRRRAEALQRELDAIKATRAVRLGGALRRILRSPFRSRAARRLSHRAAAVAAHPLFDEAWYRSRYSDVAEGDGARHYVSSGGAEGRAPHILFDPDWYGRRAAIASGATALEHYMATPAAQRPSAHPVFDPIWYLAQNADVRAADLDPLEHFLVSGGLEGRAPHPDFDAAWYLNQNPDVAEAGLNPLVHYLASGADEGRDPNPGFSSAGYLKANPDVAEAGLNPLVHYVTSGRDEGRDAGRRPASGSPFAVEKTLSRSTHASTFGRILAGLAPGLSDKGLERSLKESEARLAKITPRLNAGFDHPLVSIVMPTWNRAAVIKEAISSVVDQTYSNWELLVCDDASTDDTEDVVASFGDDRITYLKLAKGGAAAARNAGLDKAGGEIIAYLDSDNCWHPAFLARMVLALLEHSGRSAAYADFIDYEISKSGKIRVRSHKRQPFHQEKLLERPAIDLNSFVHRRELYDCFGGFNAALSRRQDYDLTIKYTWLRDPLHVPDILTLYQRNENLDQITRTHKTDMSCVPIIEQSVARYLKDGLPISADTPVRKVTIISWDLCRNHFSKPFALAEALSRDYEVQLISFRFFDEPIFPPLEGVEAPFETVYLPGGEFPAFFDSMKAALEKIDGDVIYVVKPRLPSLGLALLANQLSGAPVILEINDLETVVSSPKEGDVHAEIDLGDVALDDPDLVSPYSDLWSRLMDPVAKTVPTLVTHNKNIDAHFGNRCLYMRNLKDERVYDPDLYDRGAVRAELGFGPDDRVILFGGLLRKHKGIYELVELVERLDDERYKLLFVGSRITPDQTQLIKRFGDQIRVLPPQDRAAMARINHAADLVILWLNPDVPASHYQMPYKATDALAMKTSIIANDISDFGSLSPQGYCRLAPFGDWESMTRHVKKLFDEPEKTERMQNAGRRLYQRQFSYAAARGNFALAARRALAGGDAPLPAAATFARRFNAFYRASTGRDSDFVELGRTVAHGAPALDLPSYGVQEEDASIVALDVRAVDALSFSDPEGVAIVMPSIDTAKALETARLLVRRAGMKTTVFIVEDTLRQGFIRTLNATASQLSVKYVVYLAEDAFPGLNWLKIAHQDLEKSGKGLLAFNCGKWRGRIAAFGMVRKSWAKGLYGGDILYAGYRSHRADNEITVIARATDEFLYLPEAVLIENDPGKAFRKTEAEASNFHVSDKKLFVQRFDTAFDGAAPKELLDVLRDEYLNQRKLRK